LLLLQPLLQLTLLLQLPLQPLTLLLPPLPPLPLLLTLLPLLLPLHRLLLPLLPSNSLAGRKNRPRPVFFRPHLGVRSDIRTRARPYRAHSPMKSGCNSSPITGAKYSGIAPVVAMDINMHVRMSDLTPGWHKKTGLEAGFFCVRLVTSAVRTTS